MIGRKRTEIDWQDIRIFLALARHGSLSAAARALSVSHATISRRLRSLETRLGEKLVERRSDGYVLTQAGTSTLDAASDMEHAVQTLDRGAADAAPSGLVRINAPPALLNGFLMARLATLVPRYPRLDIELTPDHRVVSLERHETDIAVRLGQPQGGDVIASPLVTVGYGFYGTDEACRSIEASKVEALPRAPPKARLWKPRRSTARTHRPRSAPPGMAPPSPGHPDVAQHAPDVSGPQQSFAAQSDRWRNWLKALRR